MSFWKVSRRKSFFFLPSADSWATFWAQNVANPGCGPGVSYKNGLFCSQERPRFEGGNTHKLPARSIPSKKAKNEGTPCMEAGGYRQKRPKMKGRPANPGVGEGSANAGPAGAGSARETRTKGPAGADAGVSGKRLREARAA